MFIPKQCSFLRLISKSYNRQIHGNSKRAIILGIETSCDDTGCGIVDTQGNLLGEALHSQHLTHLNNGGIIPPIAHDLHRQNIENVVQQALKSASLSLNEVDAIATTVKPGLPLSLIIGAKYGKYLCKKYHKPFIPVHHMEAHALTARMFDKSIEFPFLVLLISGGHCLLAVANSVDEFLLLGESIDDAPGEAFDKMARRLKIKNLPQYSTLSGGAAIELATSEATDFLDFAGIKAVFLRHIWRAEKKGIPPDGVMSGYQNLCASFLLTTTRHLCHRVQRGMEYLARKKLIPPDKQTLVVSGGVACNNFIAEGLQIVCENLNYKFIRPPPKFCTDNGIMIAWNGVERWNANIGVYKNFDDIEIASTSQLGQSVKEDVAAENISCKWVKLSSLAKPKVQIDSEQKSMTN
ncbi:hypothetical protein GWI33_008832 [Rhynchophorus ferrugineus]|uniref:N(6)-L-threonylcarbamoyladenine synthase n=1 Tax=Rhynchophorus ferrugineus TaxID=354439 RepID=A0A834IHN2_RHYFE|nr:hypothetical protein GWI33_008832 [Rhynchophorus ferrugineus]